MIEADYGAVDRPFWNDKPTVIIGGGPSLKDFDFERLRGHAHVLAVKGSIFDVPWADAGFGLDFIRFEEWRRKLEGQTMRVYWALPRERLSAAGPSPQGNLTVLRRLDGEGLSDDPSYIYTGGTSGYGALQIAYHKFASEVYLLGYDYDGNFAPGAAFRHNDKHYQREREQTAASWAEWATYFDALGSQLDRRGVRVYNACPTSTIKAFQKVTLEDAVSRIVR